jgi:ankyrin repeat protein
MTTSEHREGLTMRTTPMRLMTTLTIALGTFLVLLHSPVMAADPNLLNYQLFYAARKGDLEQVKSLLSKGADVNAKDKDGGTALNCNNLDFI